MKNSVKFCFLFVVYSSLSTPAYAYLDGATGSIILQGIIGAATTWFIYYRMFAAKAKALLARITGRGSGEAGE